MTDEQVKENVEGEYSLDSDEEPPSRSNFSDDGIRAFSRFKEGDMYYISLVSMLFTVRLVHYHKSVNKYLRCLSYQGWCPSCEESAKDTKGPLRPASEKFGSNLFVFDHVMEDVKVDGKAHSRPAVKDGLPQLEGEIDGHIHFWNTNVKVIKNLRTKKAIWGDLSGKFVLAKCTESTFQAMEFDVVPQIPGFDTDSFPKMLQDRLSEESYPVDKLMVKEVKPVEMIQLFNLPESYMAQAKEVEKTLNEASAEAQADFSKADEAAGTKAEESGSL